MGRPGCVCRWRLAYCIPDALAPNLVPLGRETPAPTRGAGEGVLDLDRFAATLREKRYDCIVSVEVSRTLRELPVRLARPTTSTTPPPVLASLNLKRFKFGRVVP